MPVQSAKSKRFHLAQCCLSLFPILLSPSIPLSPLPRSSTSYSHRTSYITSSLLSTLLSYRLCLKCRLILWDCRRGECWGYLMSDTHIFILYSFYHNFINLKLIYNFNINFSLTHLVTYSLTHSLTRSRTPSLPHSLTHPSPFIDQFSSFTRPFTNLDPLSSLSYPRLRFFSLLQFLLQPFNDLLCPESYNVARKQALLLFREENRSKVYYV